MSVQKEFTPRVTYLNEGSRISKGCVGPFAYSLSKNDMEHSLQWRTETHKVSDLVPNAKNPRSLSAKQKADLEASITKFNLAEIPAINTDKTILAGHQRIKVLIALGRGEELANVVYCDPPYNIALDYDKGVGGGKSYGGDVDDKKSDPKYRSFLKKAMTNAIAVSAADSHHFWYHDQKYTGMMQSLYEELGVKYKRTTLWMKK